VATGDGGDEAYTAIACGVGLSHERSDIAGKPTDNAYVESFNATVRLECLGQHWFLDPWVDVASAIALSEIVYQGQEAAIIITSASATLIEFLNVHFVSGPSCLKSYNLMTVFKHRHPRI
jgi:Integrase core domain